MTTVRRFLGVSVHWAWIFMIAFVMACAAFVILVPRAQKQDDERTLLRKVAGATSHTGRRLIVFDWDDTLFPTQEFLQQYQQLDQGMPDASELPDKFQAQISEIAAKNERILNIAQSLGDTVIITSADLLWVEQTCQTYMPSLSKIVGGSVPVFSSRRVLKSEMFKHVHKEYERKYPNRGAFSEVLAVGDSNEEMDAAEHLGLVIMIRRTVEAMKPEHANPSAEVPMFLTKTVKFRRSPRIGLLSTELSWVEAKLTRIADSEKNRRHVLKCRRRGGFLWFLLFWRRNKGDWVCK